MKRNQLDSWVFDFKNLGALVRAYRKERGYTQADMAERVGITTQHYSRIERGEYTPSLQTFLSLVEILDLDMSKLRVGNHRKVSSTMYEIVYLLEKFNNVQQKAVLSFLKTMEPA
jgi:DNA-binding XRE family transcriptional regulator